MSDIDIPTIPAGLLALLSFFLPYAQALIQRPSWSSAQKKVLAIVLPLVLAAVSMVFYFVMTGEPLPSWPILVLLIVVVSQTSHSLILRKSAQVIEANVHGDHPPR